MTDTPDVRVFYADRNAAIGTFDLAQLQQRTPAQKHTDDALDQADRLALDAVVAFSESLAWARSIGVEIPARVRGVETILRQWQTHLADERKRRG